jgi:hypothetical protein
MKRQNFIIFGALDQKDAVPFSSTSEAINLYLNNVQMTPEGLLEIVF